jgi:hypothetical protein
MDIYISVALHSAQQRTYSATGGDNLVETYELVWSGTKEKEAHDRQVRPAPSIAEPHESKAHPGGFGHATKSKESVEVIDLRGRWLRDRDREIG